MVGVRDIVVLRRLELREETMRLKQALTEARKQAEKVGFTQKEIEKLIHVARKSS